MGAATSFVEGEVRRLLSGNCETWEMVMTVRGVTNLNITALLYFEIKL